VKEFLFLGAGASYECGMPLVWEFTHSLKKAILERLDTRLFNFKGNDELKIFFTSLLQNDNFHYEQIVGELEKIYIQGKKDTVHGVIIQLIECIQSMLLETEVNTIKLAKVKFATYSGIVDFLNDKGSVDVYFLNHYVIFEELCDFYNLPYKDGFFKNRKTSYDHIVNFKSITEDELNNNKFDYYNDGNINGFNLMKLHGSVDIFSANDKKLYLKCFGVGDEVGRHVMEIKKLEEFGFETIKKLALRGSNEIFVNDDSGRLQFLRRTLLSGANKFTGKFEQLAPKYFFDEFKNRINENESGHIIGYSFGDTHVNEVFIKWLENKSHTLSIYDPYITLIPRVLELYKEQVTIYNFGMTGFFNKYRSSKISLKEMIKNAGLSQVRENLKKRNLNK